MEITDGKKYKVTIDKKTTVVIARHTQKVHFDGEEFETEISPKKYLIDRACEKLFGKNCFWFADSGCPGYGQILRPVSQKFGGGNSSVTPFCALTVTPVVAND